ncbi:MAG TPA: hypothetical protein VLT62_15610 [Candidatus Methylomirabilis sp.]|nr:hypothetical protein [Candidatus Methylomirabilis sp.]
MEEVTLLFDQEIAIGLPLSGYRLVPGIRGRMGLPAEAFLELYAVSAEGEKTLIAGPADLSPLVGHIGSEDEAWRFLRLFTAPETHYFFQKAAYTTDLRVLSPGEPPAVSAISPALARQVGYQAPQIRLEGNEYVACRDLIRTGGTQRSAPVALLRRWEALSREGSYRLIEERVIGELESTQAIPPSYE